MTRIPVEVIVAHVRIAKTATLCKRLNPWWSAGRRRVWLGRCDGGRCPWAVFANVRPEDGRRGPEALEGAVDAEEEFPQELRDGREALKRAQGVAGGVAGEQGCWPRRNEERPADEAEPCGAARDEFGAVHEVAEDQSVPPADDPAGTEEEGPVLDRREGVGDRALGRPGDLVSQRDDAEHAEDADEDERALDQPRGHVAERQLLVLSSKDREDHDRGADVRDDQQQFEQGCEQDLRVMPGACDVADGMVEDRLVERQRRDRRDVRDEVEHAEYTRSLLIRTHARWGPFSGDGTGPIPSPPRPAMASAYALQSRLAASQCRVHPARPRGSSRIAARHPPEHRRDAEAPRVHIAPRCVIDVFDDLRCHPEHVSHQQSGSSCGLSRVKSPCPQAHKIALPPRPGPASDTRALAPPQTVVSPARDASVAPAAPVGTHHVRSPTIPSAATPRSPW